MKTIDGKKTLEEILKIGKAIYEYEEKINDSGIFGKDAEVQILPNIEISDVIAKITSNTLSEDEAKELNEIYKEQWAEENIVKEGDTPDWIMDSIYEYYQNDLTIQELIEILLEDN